MTKIFKIRNIFVFFMSFLLITSVGHAKPPVSDRNLPGNATICIGGKCYPNYFQAVYSHKILSDLDAICESLASGDLKKIQAYTLDPKTFKQLESMKKSGMLDSLKPLLDGAFIDRFYSGKALVMFLNNQRIAMVIDVDRENNEENWKIAAFMNTEDLYTLIQNGFFEGQSSDTKRLPNP